MRFPVVAGALLLSACAAPVVVPPARPPVIVPPTWPPTPPVPAPGSDWRDWPLTPGTWRYRQDAAGSSAVFGTGSAFDMSLRCDRAERRVRISLRRPAGAATVRTDSMLRTLTLQPAAGGPDYAVAVVPAADPLLDAMGFSRGRFVIEQAGAAPLVVPAWAEVLRVTEDCRG